MALNKPSISVVIITKDEEEKISRCLNSIKWTDEIVVVDDLSVDKTAEICREYGAKVLSNKSEGNFDRQRNIGIDNSKSDWVLQLDADEIVTEELKQGILEAVNSNHGYAAYKFKRKNYFLGHFIRYAGEYNYYVKLLRRGRARYVGRSVHETLQVDGEIGAINCDIEHRVFDSISQFIERQNFCSGVEAGLLYEENKGVPDRKIKYNLIISSGKLFWKLYFKKKGYKDGMHGIVWCVLQSVRRILIWAKYWELSK